jgi:hypothetical protein
MARKKERPGAVEGRALQYEDLDPEGRRAARENWAEMGKARSRMAGAIGAAKEAQATSENPEYRKKMGHRVASLEMIAPHVEDKPMSLQGATAARVQRLKEGAARTRAAGPEEGGLGGADWFFEHHNLIRHAAQEYGFHPHAAIAATTALSPLNAPETERLAGAAAMKLVAEPHTVEISPELRKATKQRIKDMGGPPLPREHVGQEVKVQDLHPTHVAAIASVNAKMRKQGTPIKSSAPEAFTAMGATRLSDEAARSISHLRGDIPESETISPHGAPKVWSYKEAAKAAVPGSAEHGEFGVRMHHFIHGDPQQTVLDLWGLRRSEQGVLGSGREPGTGHTPEDTWMQSVSTRQNPLNVPGSRGRGVSVAKMVGSDPKLAAADAMRKSSPTSGATVADDPRIGGTAIAHALNNKATRNASQRVKIQMGHETTNMPVLALHPMVWTEQRRQAEKDPDYKIAQQSAEHRRQIGNDRQFEAETTIAHRQKERKARGEPAVRGPKVRQTTLFNPKKYEEG